MTSLAVSILAWVVAVVAAAEATTVHYIHWNTTNPIFRIDNTDHIFDVNSGNLPWEYDQANIICPVYKPGAGTSHDDADLERYIIYNVSKEEYETCRVLSPQPRIIAQCNDPHKLMYFTITFRSFTPTPGGLEFRPGQDYYFISTSSREDVHRRAGGRCSSHNMKVMFKVAKSKDDGVEAPPPAAAGDNAVSVNVAETVPRSRLDSSVYYNAKEVTLEIDSNRFPESGDEGLIKQEASQLAAAASKSPGAASFPASVLPLLVAMGLATATSMARHCS